MFADVTVGQIPQNKGAVKMHTLLDEGPIPTFIKITSASVHDVNILDQMPIEAGAFYIMDMSYIELKM